MIGELRLTARPRVWINSVKTYPGEAPNTVRIVAAIGNDTGKLAGTGRLQIGVVDATGGSGFPLKTKKFSIQAGTTLCEVEYPIGAKPNLWDEFNPNLYQLDLTLEAAIEGKNIRDKTSVSFGIRTVSSNGKRVTINGRPIFLRGTLECCIFPDTGYPPTNASAWRRIMQICRDHGLNHLRFHSWCPPDVALNCVEIMITSPDWWNNPRREALLFECKIGKGRLLVCSIDLTTELKKRTAARQLCSSLLKYAEGKTFDSVIKMTVDQIRATVIKSPESKN